MKSELDRILSEIPVCVKDTDRKVLYQNDASKQLCGALSNTPCHKNCMALYMCDKNCRALEEGAQLFRNEIIEGKPYDVILLNDRKTITTILYPLENKYQDELDFLKKYDLSKRETEVMTLVLQGHTNSEIIRKLDISKSTLKTHLNNIYKKLPKESVEYFQKRNPIKGTH